MNGWIVLIATVALIVLSAFFVVIEFALLGARRHRLEETATTDPSARAALRGMNELTLMLAGAQLGITACTFALGAVTKPAVDAWLGPVFASWGAPEWLAGGAAFALSLLAVTFLHLVVGEMAPKSWAIAHPETAARIVGIPARAYVWPLRPFLLWVNRIANALVARSGVEPVDRAAVGGRDADTIRHLVEYSSQVGVLEPELRTQISQVIELESLTLGDITVPTATPTAVTTDADLAAVREAARRTGHLRVLVLDRDGEPRSVVHVRDTLLRDDTDGVSTLARPVLRLSQDLLVHEALRRMREASVQLVVVESEGRAVGVVTLTDVVKRVLPGEATVGAAG
ncbi:hemolysin family protein [Microbacterium chocolatum]|uniref:hemolysin family protein n=1 Tax=Microbacterium aurantiacum TaxID=162393 RepID=UPI00338F5DAD